MGCGAVGVYVSTCCNFGHRLSDGEAVNAHHRHCWIHPILLRTERDYGVDETRLVQEKFEAELGDEDWDDWDAVVAFLGEQAKR